MASFTWPPQQLTAGTGTVTSVALSDASTSPIFGVTGSPVTTSGTLTLTLATQTANRVFAGPTTGSAAQPTFRALVSADFPSSPTFQGTTTVADLIDSGLTASVPVVTDGSKKLVSLSYASFTAALSTMVGDTGSGGTKGLVPAPAMGDATNFLRGDGTWAAAGGGGGGTWGSITGSSSQAAPSGGFTGTLIVKDGAFTGLQISQDNGTGITTIMATDANNTLHIDIAGPNGTMQIGQNTAGGALTLYGASSGGIVTRGTLANNVDGTFDIGADFAGGITGNRYRSLYLTNRIIADGSIATVQYKSKETGTNDYSGSGTLSGGTVTITTTAATASSRIFLTNTNTGALTNVGTLVVSAKNVGSFVVTSSNVLDASTFDWFILTPY